MSVQALQVHGGPLAERRGLGGLWNPSARPGNGSTRAPLRLRSAWDDRKQRIAIVNQDSGDGIGFFGWEVVDSIALDDLAGRLEASGVKVTRGTRALADERHVADLIIFQDPIGNRLEAFHDAESTSDPFCPVAPDIGLPYRSARLGARRVRRRERGHCAQDAAVLPSDSWVSVSPITIPSRSKRDSCTSTRGIVSLAFVATGKNEFHHLMMELFSFDDVGQGYDLANADDRVATTLGRHTSDFMTSFYSRTPFAIHDRIWLGRPVDRSGKLAAHERRSGPSLWGHERVWTSEEVTKKARELRHANAANGLRAPVQVMEGNYQVMAGVCPWWIRSRKHRAWRDDIDGQQGEIRPDGSDRGHRSGNGRCGHGAAMKPIRTSFWPGLPIPIRSCGPASREITPARWTQAPRSSCKGVISKPSMWQRRINVTANMPCWQRGPASMQSSKSRWPCRSRIAMR